MAGASPQMIPVTLAMSERDCRHPAGKQPLHAAGQNYAAPMSGKPSLRPWPRQARKDLRPMTGPGFQSKVAGDAKTAGAQRRADRDLPLALNTARENQVAYIGAGDQQEKTTAVSNISSRFRESLATASSCSNFNKKCSPSASFGFSRLNLGSDIVQLRLCLGRGNAGLEPRNGVIHPFRRFVSASALGASGFHTSGSSENRNSWAKRRRPHTASGRAKWCGLQWPDHQRIFSAKDRSSARPHCHLCRFHPAAIISRPENWMNGKKRKEVRCHGAEKAAPARRCRSALWFGAGKPRSIQKHGIASECHSDWGLTGPCEIPGTSARPSIN